MLHVLCKLVAIVSEIETDLPHMSTLEDSWVRAHGLARETQNIAS